MGICKGTIQRVLKEANITKWMAAKRPALTLKVAKKRLTWCKERRA